MRTQKGKGYKPPKTLVINIMEYQNLMSLQENKQKLKLNIPSYTKVFAETLIKHAEQDTKIVGITGAMPSGTGLNLFEKIP